MKGASLPLNIRNLPEHLREDALSVAWKRAEAMLHGDLRPASRATVALHEAGHAVVGDALGAQVVMARLELETTTPDQLVRAGFARPATPITEWKGETRWQAGAAWEDSARRFPSGASLGFIAGPVGIASRAVIVLAGSVAEELFDGRDPCLALIMDYNEERLAAEHARLVATLLPSRQGDSVEAVCAWMRDAAGRILRENEAALRRLQHRLLHRDIVRDHAIRRHLHDLRPFDLAADFEAILGAPLLASWPDGAVA